MTPHSDDYYANAYSCFVSKFECASNFLKNRGIPINDRVDYRCFSIADRTNGRDGIAKRKGIEHPIGHWFFEKDVNKVIAASGIHPFAIMLDGKRNRTGDASNDIERIFGFHYGTITEAFVQGFIYEAGYSDCWYDAHWSVQSAFHIGRHLLNKHYVSQSKLPPLPCKIPTLFLTRGIIK